MTPSPIEEALKKLAAQEPLSDTLAVVDIMLPSQGLGFARAHRLAAEVRRYQAHEKAVEGLVEAAKDLAKWRKEKPELESIKCGPACPNSMCPWWRFDAALAAVREAKETL